MDKKNLVELFGEELEKSKQKVENKYMKIVQKEIKNCMYAFHKETISGQCKDYRKGLDKELYPITINTAVKMPFPAKDTYFCVNYKGETILIEKDEKTDIITISPFFKQKTDIILKWWERTKGELKRDGKIIDDINDLVGKKLPDDETLRDMLKYAYGKDFVQYDSRIYNGIVDKFSADEYVMKDCYTVKDEEIFDIIIYYGNNTLDIFDVDVRKQ